MKKHLYQVTLFAGGEIIPELKILSIPDDTCMEEHSIIVKGDIFIGNNSELGYGIIANSLVIGEKVIIEGDVLTNSDIRIDNWSSISGDVRTDSDAYLGEFVNIGGRLYVNGNLDVGKSVIIKHGFEAKGNIAVRNPIPVTIPFIVFIYMYLMTLLRLGNKEEVEKAIEQLFDDEEDSLNVMTLPARTKVNLETIKTDGKIKIGKNCRLQGNIRSRSLEMGRNTTLFGGVKTTGNVTLGRDCTVHGTLVSKGNITVDRNSHIFGNIEGDTIAVHETAQIDGMMNSIGEVTVIKDDLDGLDDIEKNVFYGLMLIE